MPAAELRLLLTCEHGGRQVPARYRAWFRGRDAWLRSHRGWDPGALDAARRLARDLRAPLVAATTTRLLVDPNRSPHNPRVFSEIARAQPAEARAELLARHHAPHWERVRALLDAHRGPTLHVAIHSFTPVWKGERRAFTVGILYDPKRPRERALAARWQGRLGAALGPGEVRRNAPYRGDSDGLTTALRRERPARRYLGLEIELNQAALADAGRRRRLVALLAATLADEVA